jgi:hypothetical protein
LRCHWLDPPNIFEKETVKSMYLLTEWKGRTGRYLAQGHGRMYRVQQGVTAKKRKEKSRVENKNERKTKTHRHSGQAGQYAF